MERAMLRILGLAVVLGVAAIIAAHGGHVGPYDLADVPLPLVAFGGVTLLVLYSLRSI
jgi:hypothetical protein